MRTLARGCRIVYELLNLGFFLSLDFQTGAEQLIRSARLHLTMDPKGDIIE